MFWTTLLDFDIRVLIIMCTAGVCLGRGLTAFLSCDFIGSVSMVMNKVEKRKKTFRDRIDMLTTYSEENAKAGKTFTRVNLNVSRQHAE